MTIAVAARPQGGCIPTATARLPSLRSIQPSDVAAEQQEAETEAFHIITLTIMVQRPLSLEQNADTQFQSDEVRISLLLAFHSIVLPVLLLAP